MIKWMQKHWVMSIVIFAVFALIFIISGVIRTRNQQKTEVLSTTVGSQNEDKTGSSNSEDSILMRQQSELIAKYGNLPEGYLWDLDGTLLSQGDKSMSAEEVLYAYINGLKSLDFSMAQKYSRNSRVVETYSGYFDSMNSNTDYSDAFYRNMYKQALLSMQVLGIESNSIFADNKQVFTVRIQMLDLTDKTFWVKDKYYIYQSLRVYSEEDSTKADLFLYDYILNYYKSEEAATREVTFDITLEKYIDLDTGWLVSIDTDIDNACKYSDGTPVIRYIKEMYNSEGRDMINSQESTTPDGTSVPTGDTSVEE